MRERCLPVWILSLTFTDVDCRKRQVSMPRKISRNAPCPCGSGKKYKQCCHGKDFDWVETEDGGIGRSIEMPEELQELVGSLFESFRARHGRDPGPTDRLFDEAPHLEHIEHYTVEAMKRAGVEDALIHACEETNLLLSEKNERLVSESDVAEWERAIDEHEKKTSTKAAHRRLTEDDMERILSQISP